LGQKALEGQGVWRPLRPIKRRIGVKNILVVGSSGQPRIGETHHLERAFAFGRDIYRAETSGELFRP